MYVITNKYSKRALQYKGYFRVSEGRTYLNLVIDPAGRLRNSDMSPPSPNQKDPGLACVHFEQIMVEEVRDYDRVNNN